MANWALVSLTIGIVLLTVPHQTKAPSSEDIVAYPGKRRCPLEKGIQFTTNPGYQTSWLMHLSSKNGVMECNEIVLSSDLAWRD